MGYKVYISGPMVGKDYKNRVVEFRLNDSTEREVSDKQKPTGF